MHPALHGVKAVFFDAVGTLLFPAQSVAVTYRRIAAQHGLELDEPTLRARLIAAFERQETVDHRAGWRTDELREVERWQSIVSETLREADDPKACFESLWAWYSEPSAWQANPDTEEVLNALSERGLILGMASNFDGRLTGIIGRIEAFARVQERCVVSSLIMWRKPAGAFFAEVVRIAGCKPEEILFVGDDRRNDLDGATDSGLRGLLLEMDKSENPRTESIRRLRDLLND